MAQEKPNRLGEWLLLARKQIPVARQYAANWLAAVREEPALAWETPAVRYATYGLGGLLLLWLLTSIAGGLAPPPPASAQAPATAADYHVVCANPACQHHFVMHREFGFHKFPVECSKCQRTTGMQARMCTSPVCQSRWIVPERKNDGLYCPICGNRFE